MILVETLYNLHRLPERIQNSELRIQKACHELHELNTNESLRRVIRCALPRGQAGFFVNPLPAQSSFTNDGRDGGYRLFCMFKSSPLRAGIRGKKVTG